jgi:hypothetical protein
MQHRRSAVFMAASAGLVLAACSPLPDTGTDGVLIISAEVRDGRSGPEALWEGVVVIADSGCVRGRMKNGSYYNLEFPAGTHFDDSGRIDMGFATVVIGEEVAFGGGYMTESSPSTDRPDSCVAGSTFQVYTI